MENVKAFRAQLQSAMPTPPAYYCATTKKNADGSGLDQPCSPPKPLTTTEFMAFAKRHEQFQAVDCELLGLSIDSTFSHVARVRNIKGKFGVEVKFPNIADLSMQVAKAYGMIQPGASDTSAVRATFIIDPEGVLRAMLYYPMSNGRTIDEILRLVKALQTSDEHQVATPEAWQPGEKVIVPPPASVDEAAARAANAAYECTDWYFCKKAV